MQSLPTPVTTRVQSPVPTRLGLPVLAAGAVADSAPAQPAPPPPPASPPQPRKVQQTPPPPPAPAAPAPSPASPAENVQERAAGTGKSQAKGDGGPDAATTGDPGRATSLKNRWGAAIIARVERQKRQPRRGAKGTTRLRLTVSSAGRLVAVSIAKSSGNAELDQAALRAVRKARMPRAPKALPSGDYKFSFRMTFAG
ncbi:energy transducer TonB [Leisingera sp. XS_AS12]|uniref:energy transducer TonB family protein n=1 Tax=Leisingera sp. XS_AS12 TaxID=3241294 RepID=UPI003519040D